MTSALGAVILVGQLNAAQPSAVVVSDVQGRTLKKAYVNGQTSIDLRDAGNGAYLVSIHNGHSAVTRKVIVQR